MIATMDAWYNTRIERNKRYDAGSAETISDFYKSFIECRLPEKETVLRWNELITRYINDPDTNKYITRKYESRKKDGQWDNRRGAVCVFENGIEVIYGSNFLAHEIYLMALKGFVPEYADFKRMIDERKLHILRGTRVEKDIALYGGTNKKLDEYLAHVVDVNGKYSEQDAPKKIYPVGRKSDWTQSPDRRYHVNGSLSDDEIEVLKAHMLRFLSPMNYFLTPQTKDCAHLTKNIGDYMPVQRYVAQQFRLRYGAEYDRFLGNALFSIADTEAKDEKIDLTYCGFGKTAASGAAIRPEKKEKEKDPFSTWLNGKIKSSGTYLCALNYILGELRITFEELERDIDIYLDRINNGSDAELGKVYSGAGSAVLGKVRLYKTEKRTVCADAL